MEVFRDKSENFEVFSSFSELSRLKTKISYGT
jgi:hypothetical protein